MSSTATTRVGWIGLSSMGLPMATNIQKYLSENNQPALRYWNRTTSKGDTLKNVGGVPARSIDELAEACDVIWISVIDDAALQEHHPPHHLSLLSWAVNGATFIAAQCTGLPPSARAGHLLIAVGGPAEAIQRIGPYLEGVPATSTIQAGDDPSKAALLKTTVQYLRGGFMYLICEAQVLAEKTRLPASTLKEMLEKNFGPYTHAICQLPGTGAYIPAANEEPKAALALALKDIGYGVSVANDVGMELKCADLLVKAATGAKKYGEEKGRKMDVSSIYGSIRRDTGLDFETQAVKERDAGREKGD